MTPPLVNPVFRDWLQNSSFFAGRTTQFYHQKMRSEDLPPFPPPQDYSQKKFKKRGWRSMDPPSIIQRQIINSIRTMTFMMYKGNSFSVRLIDPSFGYQLLFSNLFFISISI